MDIAFSKYRLFTYFGLFLIGLELLGLVMTMGGFFYEEIILAYLILAAFLIIFLLIANRNVVRQNLKFLPIVIISLAVIMWLSSQTIPTIFSGRDQGSLSEAAIRLSQNHQLTFSSPASEEFFKIYGPGQALNFPGFSYTQDGKLITNFPLGYISWLAIFYSLFGLPGLTLANAVALFIFLVSFLLVARYFMRPFAAVWAWILIITSFAFTWFFKFTLSENLALAFFWLGFWAFITFLRRERSLYLAVALTSFMTLAFTRVEALAVIIMAIIVLLLKYRQWNSIKENIVRAKIILPLLLLVILLAADMFVNLPFYRVFAKGFLNSFAGNDLPDGSPYSFPYPYLYLLKVLGIYAILHFLILSAFGVVYLLRNKRYEYLIGAFISLPILIYLINPSISLDHPWMLRRFVFIILPVAILYAVILFDKIFSRKIYVHVAMLLLLAANLFVAVPYLPIAENRNLLPGVDELGRNFSPSDLILLDREATGSGWSMATGPLGFLYGKQAVYFFNPDDLSKITASRFSHVYLVIPDKNADFYEKSGIMDQFVFKREYRLTTNLLDVKTGKKSDLYSEPVRPPQEQDVIVYGKIYELK